jgi:hypothetical protein
MTLEPFTITFVEAFTGAMGTAALAGILALVRFIDRLLKQTKHMESKLDELIETNIEQSETIYEVAKIQKPQLSAHKAALEALKGECNGNVDRAHEGIMDSTKEFDDFLTRRLKKEKSK